MFGTIIWVGVGLALVWFIWKVGFGMLRSMTSSLPPPPPSGEMRRINVRYRCSVCGMELKLTLHPTKTRHPPSTVWKKCSSSRPLTE